MGRPCSLVQVAEAYSGYTRASTIPQKIEASYEAERQLRSLTLWGQLHPNLEADTHFTEMMRQLSGTEDRLADQRMRYNSSVSVLNKEVKSFYGRLVARLAKVEEGTYYEPPARVTHIGDSEVTFQETVYDSGGQPQVREVRIRQ